MRRDPPGQPKRIAYAAGAAVWFVLNLADFGGSRRNRPFHQLVDVVDIQEHVNRRTIHRLDAAQFRKVGILVVNHDAGIADLEFAVPDQAIGICVPKSLFSSERFLIELLHKKFATKPWADLLAPAVELARNGFPVTYEFSNSLRAAGRAGSPAQGTSALTEPGVLGQFPESKRTFLRDGKYYEPGETFRQPELARTLERTRNSAPAISTNAKPQSSSPPRCPSTAA